MWQSQEWNIARSLSMTITLAANGLIPLEEIDNVFSYGPTRADQAYAESFLAIAYLQHQAGPDAVYKLVQAMQYGKGFPDALEQVCSCSYSAFQEGWKRYMHREYGILSLIASLFSTTYLWIGFAMLFLVVYVVKRYRSKATIRQWEWEEQQPLEPHIIEFRRRREDG
jgi:hypothetical protein